MFIFSKNRNRIFDNFSTLWAEKAAKAFKIIDFPFFSRSLCEDQTFRCQRKENWKEEEDDGEKCQSESVLQRVICLHGGPKYVNSNTSFRDKGNMVANK